MNLCVPPHWCIPRRSVGLSPVILSSSSKVVRQEVAGPGGWPLALTWRWRKRQSFGDGCSSIPSFDEFFVSFLWVGAHVHWFYGECRKCYPCSGRWSSGLRNRVLLGLKCILWKRNIVSESVSDSKELKFRTEGPSPKRPVLRRSRGTR